MNRQQICAYVAQAAFTDAREAHGDHGHHAAARRVAEQQKAAVVPSTTERHRVTVTVRSPTHTKTRRPVGHRLT
jgi:hypothetical protein